MALSDSQSKDTVKKARPGDFFIPVLGPSGHGKSTFVLNILKFFQDSGSVRQTRPRVDDGLAACTTNCQIYFVDIPASLLASVQGLGGRRLLLVDTPGLDMGQLSEKKIMEGIQSSLQCLIDKQFILLGAIYTFPISKDRHTMTDEKNQFKLECLFGESALRTVVLATTRWNYPMDAQERTRRRKALEQHWGEVCRLDNSSESAWELVETLLGRYAAGIVPRLSLGIDTWRLRVSRPSGLVAVSDRPAAIEGSLQHSSLSLISDTTFYTATSMISNTTYHTATSSSYNPSDSRISIVTQTTYHTAIFQDSSNRANPPPEVLLSGTDDENTCGNTRSTPYNNYCLHGGDCSCFGNGGATRSLCDLMEEMEETEEAEDSDLELEDDTRPVTSDNSGSSSPTSPTHEMLEAVHGSDTNLAILNDEFTLPHPDDSKCSSSPISSDGPTANAEPRLPSTDSSSTTTSSHPPSQVILQVVGEHSTRYLEGASNVVMGDIQHTQIQTPPGAQINITYQTNNTYNFYSHCPGCNCHDRQSPCSREARRSSTK